MDYVWGLWRNLLAFLGFADLDAKVILLGLDNAGKTTLLSRLTEGTVKSCVPTHQPNHQEVVYGKLTLKMFDMGGHETARKLWKNYLIETDLIVFVVDVSDSERLAETKHELDQLLNIDHLRKVPFLVLGNKIDSREAISEANFREVIGLPCSMTSGKDVSIPLSYGTRPIEVFMCSAIRGWGYTEGFKWAIHYLEQIRGV